MHFSVPHFRYQRFRPQTDGAKNHNDKHNALRLTLYKFTNIRNSQNIKRVHFGATLALSA